jgi:pimeloyl-ACP methyl ester carboxylesterase
MAQSAVIELSSFQDEFESGPNNGNEISEGVVVFGGLLTTDRYRFLYSRILGLDISSGLSAKERFIAPPDRGVATVERLREGANAAFRRLTDRSGPVHIVGHSLGGFTVTQVAMDNPDRVLSVSCLAGAQDGLSRETLGSRALRRLVGNPKEARLLKHDSGFMNAHRDRVATDWPKGVPLYMTATVWDQIIAAPQGLGLEPRGGNVHRRLVVPPLVRGCLARFVLDHCPEDTQPLHHGLVPVEHINIVLSRMVLTDMSEVCEYTAKPEIAGPIGVAQALPIAALAL